MPFFYDNNGKYSEAVMKLSGTASDWTRDGITSLSLWFKGYPAYVGSFVEAPAGTYTMTSSALISMTPLMNFTLPIRRLAAPSQLS